MTSIEWVIEALHNVAHTIESWDRESIEQDDVTALNEAAGLVEKQIPQKVRVRDLNYRKQVPFCPQCESDITHFAIDSVEYCPFCGQALDWSKEEEE